MHVADVEDGVGEVFHEDAGGDIGGELAGFQLILDARVFANGEGSQAQGGISADAGAKAGEEQHGGNNGAAGNAGGAHGGDFAIGRHAPQSDEDADQHAEGNGERQYARQG